MTALTTIKQIYGIAIDWHRQHSPYSLCILLSIVAIILCGLGLLLNKHHIEVSKRMSTQRYGQHITEMAASQLSQAAANKNLISLQAALNQLTQEPHISTAIIYDLNNRIVVQAGAEPKSEQESSITDSYSASIAQDETILGRLSISAQPLHLDDYSFLAFLGLLFFLCLLCFSFIKTKIQTITVKSEKTEPQHTPTEQTDTTAPHTIILLLQLKNIDTVFQQLNKSMREEHLNSIQSSIEKILKLYNGNIHAMDADSLCIHIEDNEKERAVFNALCCSELIRKIAKEYQWLIQVNSVIYDTTDTSSLALLSGLQQLKKSSDSGIYIQTPLQTSAVKQFRISTASSDKKIDPFIKVNQFSEKYQRLLEKQRQHLINRH